MAVPQGVGVGKLALGRIVAALTVPVWLTGCSVSSQPKHVTGPPKPTHLTSTTATTPTQVAVGVSCVEGQPSDPDSPAYAGAGPHLMIGFEGYANIPTNVIPPDSSLGPLPSKWAADPEYGDVFMVAPPNYIFQRAQLILCESAPQSVGTEAIGSCSYSYTDEGPYAFGLDVVSAMYTFTLFEARTGHLVTSFQLQASDPHGCPDKIHGNGKGLVIAARLDEAAVEAKLRPYVEGNVPAR